MGDTALQLLYPRYLIGMQQFTGQGAAGDTFMG